MQELCHWFCNKNCLGPRSLTYYKMNVCMASHCMARANRNKSKLFLTSATIASKYTPQRPRICINWNPPFQTFIHKIFKNCLLLSKSCFTMFPFRSTFTESTWVWKGGFQLMQILGLLGMYFDAVVVEVKTFLLLFRLALTILCVFLATFFIVWSSQ